MKPAIIEINLYENDSSVMYGFWASKFKESWRFTDNNFHRMTVWECLMELSNIVREICD